MKEENRKRYTEASKTLTEFRFDDKLKLIKCGCGKVYASTDGHYLYIKCTKCKKLHKVEMIYRKH